MGDEYVKERRLGRGSFGVAFLVRHKPSNQPAVLKEIYLKGLSPTQRDSARRELTLLQQLSHAHIVSYLESWETPLKLFLLMDYCPQGDLAQYLQNRRGVALPETLVCHWLTQIALALNYLHRRKVLHRDVKCENIFLDDTLRLKLGDFGIARVLDHSNELASTCIGTPTYLSPELCRHAPYNHKSDVWALGCVFYQITALKPPFQGRTLQQLMTNILRGRYAPLPPRYSYELRQLASKLLRTLAEDRPDAAQILRNPFLSDHVKKWAISEEEKRDFAPKMVPKPRPKPLPSPGLKIKSLASRKNALGHLTVYSNAFKRNRTPRKLAKKPLEPNEKFLDTCKPPPESACSPVEAPPGQLPAPHRRKQWPMPSQSLLSALSAQDVEISVESVSEDDQIDPILEENDQEDTALTLERRRCYWEAVLGIDLLKQLYNESWKSSLESAFLLELGIARQLPIEFASLAHSLAEFIEEDVRFYSQTLD